MVTMTSNPRRPAVLAGVRARPRFTTWVAVVILTEIIVGAAHFLAGS